MEAGVHGALRLVPRAAPPPSWLWARVFPDPEGAGSASLDGRPPCPRPSGAFRSSGQPPALPTLSVICRFPLLLRVEVCFLTASRAPGLHLSVAAPPISLLAGGELKDPSLSSAESGGCLLEDPLQPCPPPPRPAPLWPLRAALWGDMHTFLRFHAHDFISVRQAGLRTVTLRQAISRRASSCRDSRGTLPTLESKESSSSSDRHLPPTLGHGGPAAHQVTGAPDAP